MQACQLVQGYHGGFCQSHTVAESVSLSMEMVPLACTDALQHLVHFQCEGGQVAGSNSVFRYNDIFCRSCEDCRYMRQQNPSNNEGLFAQKDFEPNADYVGSQLVSSTITSEYILSTLIGKSKFREILLD